jgi:outer membrane receptor for ferrienterochelin and colicin
MIRFFFLILSFVFPLTVFSQSLSGFVRDKNTGESIVGATVRLEGTTHATQSNNYGYFSLPVLAGSSVILVSSMGYKTLKQSVSLQSNTPLILELEEEPLMLNEVVKKADADYRSLDKVPIGVTAIPVSRLKAVPVLFGEADILKALALTPGVSTANEGTAGIMVRGGTPDQNLILIDETPVYNVSHLFGLVSVFNPDAIKSVTLYKSSFPARFGGRLSSVIDIVTKEGSSKKRNLEVGVGLINSRVLFEGPLQKDKENSPTFFLSGRLSNLALISLPTFISYQKSPFGSFFNYSMYDINAKLSKQFKNHSQLFFSSYLGNDLWFVKEKSGRGKDFNTANLNWGNYTGSLRYILPFNQKLFFKSTAAYTNYHYGVGSKTKEEGSISNYIDSKTTIEDIILKPSLEFYPNSKQEIRVGTDLTLHKYTPVAMKTSYDMMVVDNKKQTQAIETGSYVDITSRPLNRLEVSAGIRYTTFAVEKKNFNFWEPRLAANLSLPAEFSFKVGYARMKQYLHLLNNSSGGLPNDLWIPATERIPPQTSSQFTAGISKNIGNGISFSVEAYRKTFTDLIEYKDGFNYLTNTNRSYEELVEKNGIGKAHGAELLVDKAAGRFTGWLAYAMAWNYRKFENINSGNWFAANYDRRHIVSLVGNYKINDRIDISSNWVFQSGSPTTVPVAVMKNPLSESYSSPIPIYSERNNYRMPAYHRLDFSINFKKETQKGNLRTWTLGVYNTYNQTNPFYLRLKTDYSYSEPNGWSSSSRKITGFDNQLLKQSVIPFLPFINYSIKIR